MSSCARRQSFDELRRLGRTCECAEKCSTRLLDLVGVITVAARHWEQESMFSSVAKHRNTSNRLHIQQTRDAMTLRIRRSDRRNGSAYPCFRRHQCLSWKNVITRSTRSPGISFGQADQIQNNVTLSGVTILAGASQWREVFFRPLGVSPIVGRTLTQRNFMARMRSARGGASYRLWQRKSQRPKT